MLVMRPNCERCGKDLPAQTSGALICSFECTFCEACNASDLKGTCPNCAGGLSPRPTRTGQALTKFPPKPKPA